MLQINADALRQRFNEEVKLRAYDDHYIDLKEEKEILQIGIQQGMTLAQSQDILRFVCRKEGYAVESVIEEQIDTLLTQFASSNGKIDEKSFHHTVALVQKESLNRLTPQQCQQKVKKIMEAKGLQPKLGFLTNWYKRV